MVQIHDLGFLLRFYLSVLHKGEENAYSFRSTSSF